MSWLLLLLFCLDYGGYWYCQLLALCFTYSFCYLIIGFRNLLLSLRVFGGVNYYLMGEGQVAAQCRKPEFSTIEKVRAYTFQTLYSFFRISHIFRGEVQNHQKRQPWQIPAPILPHTPHTFPLTLGKKQTNKKKPFWRPSNRHMMVTSRHQKYSKATIISL